MTMIRKHGDPVAMVHAPLKELLQPEGRSGAGEGCEVAAGFRPPPATLVKTKGAESPRGHGSNTRRGGRARLVPGRIGRGGRCLSAKSRGPPAAPARDNTWWAQHLVGVSCPSRFWGAVRSHSRSVDLRSHFTPQNMFNKSEKGKEYNDRRASACSLKRSPQGKWVQSS